GRSKSRDSSQNSHAAILMGSRGSIYTGKRRQIQRFSETAGALPLANVETFEESYWGADLRWKYFSFNHTVRSRSSNLAPIKSKRTGIGAGGDIFQGFALIGGWSRERTLFLLSQDEITAKDYFVSLTVAPVKNFETNLKAQKGLSYAPSTPARYQSLSAKIQWTLRAISFEAGDLWLERWAGDSYTQENFIHASLARKF
ncbi:MAG: hypothetical protein AAB091_01655, partial [Elusimicrobiota bacterium]